VERLESTGIGKGVAKEMVQGLLNSKVLCHCIAKDPWEGTQQTDEKEDPLRLSFLEMERGKKGAFSFRTSPVKEVGGEKKGNGRA